jgi:hypothetical protein
MATTGCGISHKDTKHTDKCSNNNKTKTTQKQHDETTDKYFFSKYFKDNTKKKEFDIKFTHIIQGPYSKQKGEKLLHILWVIFKR